MGGGIVAAKDMGPAGTGEVFAKRAVLLEALDRGAQKLGLAGGHEQSAAPLVHRFAQAADVMRKVRAV